MSTKLKKELDSFSTIWKTGYFTRVDAHERNIPQIILYLQDNIEKGLNILEIGCGKGFWSKEIYERLDPNKLTCIDAKSEEQNGFWKYVGEPKKDKTVYHHVTNFNLDEVPDNSLDFVFSYDVFVHMSLSGQSEYLKNLFKKCKTNAKLLISYADARKYSQVNNIRPSIEGCVPYDELVKCKNLDEAIDLVEKECDTHYVAGQWFWVGKKKFLDMCDKFGYKVITEDLDIDKVNRLTLFEKP